MEAEVRVNRRRSDIEIMADMLKVGENGAGKTEIMYSANMSYSQIQKYLGYLMAEGFIDKMKKLGCRFALDKFGTGFSSFTHLRHLPVDFVKIDGSFVEGMAGSDRDSKMVESIAQLAKSLQMTVIAEHVDGLETLNALRECGVDYVQGRYLGQARALAELDMRQVLAAQPPALA